MSTYNMHKDVKYVYVQAGYEQNLKISVLKDVLHILIANEAY